MKSKILMCGLVYLLLSLGFSNAGQDLGKKHQELIGTWKCRYKIISWWTTYITVTKVKNNGQITAKDEWGNKMSGWARNDVAFICEEESNYIWESFYFTFKGKRFAKYLSVIEFIKDFESDWGKMNVKKTSSPMLELNQISAQDAEWLKLQEMLALKSQSKQD